MADSFTRRYSILIACIGQDRAPRIDEVERVTQRVLREGFGTRDKRDHAAALRIADRVANIALLGGSTTG